MWVRDPVQQLSLSYNPPVLDDSRGVKCTDKTLNSPGAAFQCPLKPLIKSCTALCKSL